MKVSVIIPVYNTEKYLSDCLTSLVNQTFKDFEVIVIDDGSSDSSREIINKYVKDYPKIVKFFPLCHQGISKSRNYGIKKAVGKYLTFIDSDDYVHSNFLKDMYEAVTKAKADIVVCDYYNVRGKEIEAFKLDDFNLSNVKNNPQLLLKINSSPCNKLFKKELFNNLEFEDIKYEDFLLVTKLICSAQKIIKLDKCLNYFRVRENSETTVVDERVFDILKILDKLNNYFKENDIFDNFYGEVEYFNIYRVTMYIIQQRYQKDKNIRNRFIDTGYDFLKNNFTNWKKNSYYQKQSIFKRFVKNNPLVAKIYVNVFNR